VVEVFVVEVDVVFDVLVIVVEVEFVVEVVVDVEELLVVVMALVKFVLFSCQSKVRSSVVRATEEA
jgi:hypothetical protein